MIASTSILCHRERGTGERVWPHHNRGTVHAHIRHVSQRSARAALTAGSGPFDETSAAVAGIWSIFIGLPQRPLRGSGQFSWDSRTSRCGNKIHLMGPLRGAQPEIAPDRCARPRSHLYEHKVCLEVAVVISEDQLLDQRPRRERYRWGRFSPPQPHPPHLLLRV